MKLDFLKKEKCLAKGCGNDAEVGSFLCYEHRKQLNIK